MKQEKQMPKRAKTSDARRRDLAKIHIAKKQLGLNDETYREMLRNIDGVSSAADLDQRGRSKVLGHLRKLGFKSAHRSAKASGMHRPAATDRAPMIAKIGAILSELKLPWCYADGIAKRMFRIDKVRWLEPKQLHKLVAALVYMQKRARASKSSREKKNG